MECCADSEFGAPDGFQASRDSTSSLHSFFVIEVLRWNLALASCTRRAQWRKALSLLQQLKGYLQPDLITLNSCIRACTKASKWHLASELLDDLESHSLSADLRSFTSLLGFQKDHQAWIRALQTLEAIRLAELRPDSVALNAVLHSCAESMHWRRTLSLLEEIRRDEHDEMGFGVALSSTLSSLVKCARWQLAFTLLQEKDVKDIDAVLLCSVLRLCRAGHLWHLGLSLLKTAGAPPDAAVYNSAISMCAEAGQWRAALQVLAEAHERKRLDTTGYNAAITACDRGRAWQEALHIFHMAGERRDLISLLLCTFIDTIHVDTLYDI